MAAPNRVAAYEIDANPDRRRRRRFSLWRERQPTLERLAGARFVQHFAADLDADLHLFRPRGREVGGGGRVSCVSVHPVCFFRGRESAGARQLALERVDIHRVQICALTIDSMDMNALGVCS